MSEAVNEFSVSLEQVHDYEFRVRFDKEQFGEFSMDEPPPLGGDAGANPSRILAAAVGHCLSASMLFCARKGHVEVGRIQTRVKVQIVRNENRRLRIGKVEVLIDPGIADSEKEKAARCMEIFEDYCTVTQSVRNGIPVEVAVEGFRNSQ